MAAMDTACGVAAACPARKARPKGAQHDDSPQDAVHNSGFAAAILWFMSAAGKLPLAPGAAIGGTSPTDPFNLALRHAAVLNQWAAGVTGVSVLFLALAEGNELRRAR